MINMLNKIPIDSQKKQSTMEGLSRNDEWDADFISQKSNRKMKECKDVRQKVKSKIEEPSASSSRGG